jgi:hypothetical protein
VFEHQEPVLDELERGDQDAAHHAIEEYGLLHERMRLDVFTRGIAV